MFMHKISTRMVCVNGKHPRPYLLPSMMVLYHNWPGTKGPRHSLQLNTHCPHWCGSASYQDVSLSIICLQGKAGKRKRVRRYSSFSLPRSTAFLHAKKHCQTARVRYIKGPFTWRWGTPGRWGNPLRWGSPPVHIISHFNVITFTC